MKQLSDFISSKHPETLIAGLEFDSRRIEKNWAFFAFAPVSGGRPGDLFINQAISSGAAAVICRDSEPNRAAMECNPSTEFIFTSSPQAEFARWCSIFWDRPQDSFPIIGVTGTDGKTTTCSFLYQILNTLGIRTALLSTVSMDSGSGIKSSPYRQSTPEADRIFSFLSDCRASKVQAVVMETTSHSLSPLTSRLSQISFAGAVFTTISSEHLEFHGTLEKYVDAKMNLARQTSREGFVIYPSCSQYGSLIRSSFKGDNIQPCDVSSLTILSRTIDQTVLQEDCMGVSFCYGPEAFLQNALEALMAARAFTGRQIPLSILSTIVPVRGRMETKRTTRGVFIVDFAHTADAFSRLFCFVKQMRPQCRITAVFSSGGHRDIDKRSKMGIIASKMCNTMILTSEDPRDEGFEKITSDILSKADTRDCSVLLVPDRAEAIRKAVSISAPGTVTLLLGKGHEKTIEFENGRSIAWNESEVLASALKEAGIE